jgi:GNAT superfamily N-acetyltransferase
MLAASDAALLQSAAPGVFDADVDAVLSAEFLNDPRHHIAAAVVDGQVVGFASAVHYVHPDKPAQLFINEVGVAPTHQRQGIGRQLLAALLEHGRSLGCVEAWVGTEPGNEAARRLYAAAGGVEDEEPHVLVSFPL